MTHETKDVVEPFVTQSEAEYPILCQGRGQINDYSTGGVPTAYLIDADGTVAWHGHPGDLQDSDIEEHLKKVDKANRVASNVFLIKKSLPPIPESLSAIEHLLEKMKFGEALKKTEAAVEKMEGDEQAAGNALREWIENRGKQDMEKAAAFVADGKIYKGYLQYEEVGELFKGHDLSKQAKDAAKELKRDKHNALEIKASEKLDKIKKEMAGERKAEDKLKCLKPLLGKKYEETLAGKQAAEMAAELEKSVDK